MTIVAVTNVLWHTEVVMHYKFQRRLEHLKLHSNVGGLVMLAETVSLRY